MAGSQRDIGKIILGSEERQEIGAYVEERDGKNGPVHVSRVVPDSKIIVSLSHTSNVRLNGSRKRTSRAMIFCPVTLALRRYVGEYIL